MTEIEEPSEVVARAIHEYRRWTSRRRKEAMTPGIEQTADSEAVSEKEEAVARVICSACYENPDDRGDAQGNDYRWQDYLEPARAAIDVMSSW
jgi:hypothetical protein